ncbi:MAG TPA: hypothetical protein VKU41_30665 [Polyangiaceae bacterium]|nr:hypothetical protein [Polyangiaceae bacterium]
MSIFSKLFPGDPKGENDPASASPPAAADKAPATQRLPGDAKQGPPAPPDSQKQKAAAPRPPAQKSGSGHKASTTTQPLGSAKQAATAVKPAVPPPVVVTKSIDVGVTPRSRPAMPAIQIGPPTAPAAPTAPVAAPAAKAAPSPPAVEHSAPRIQPKPLVVEPERPSSVRPTAPEMAPPSGGVASISDTFERLLSAEDLDAGFASLEREAGTAGPQGGHGVAAIDLAEVRSLFEQLAANHVRQVRDFMIDLRWSEATIDWLPICEPAMRSLRRAADKLELGDLCGALDRFADALSGAHAAGERTIGGTRRETLLARYEELSALMPQAFALDMDRTQREAVILQSLLLQVPEVKKVTLDRMYAAGLTTLEAMFLATPGDIAATTGITVSLATRIVERFRNYRDQVKTTVPDATRAQERQRVAELTARLRREHDEYERAAEAWSRDAADKKKELRKARAQTLLDIRVELARLGEVQRLDELERLPFDKKLTHLEAFLEEARDKYVAQP